MKLRKFKTTFTFIALGCILIGPLGCGNRGELGTAFDNATEEQLAAARERDSGEEEEEKMAEMEMEDEK